MQTHLIIATSFKRTSWLLERSLLSVYLQEGINKEEIKVLIIDDNRDNEELSKISYQVLELKKKLNIKEYEFQTSIIKNQRTRFMSGTGAWNTGIFEAYKNDPNGYVSILDDDDEYLPNHLADCINIIDNKTVAIFQRLFWKNEDGKIINHELTEDDLNAPNFFIGNPGIQGSNMFFKTKYLVEIGGFDEKFPNTTDRDLMIRLLWHVEKLKISQSNELRIKIIENKGVIHYNHQSEKVNNNIQLKQKGLDIFYQKYRAFFSEADYQKSLARANTLFNYKPIE